MSTIEQTWKDLQSGAVKAVESTFPIEGRHRRLQLNKITVDEKGAKIGDIRGQENAKDRGRSWGASIHGDVSLIDKKTGKVLNRSKVKLMTLPRPTDRYSYIVNGNEYQVANLWKLKAGVYSMVKQNGDLETEFNLGGAKGEAAQFAKESIVRVPFSPKTQKFKFQWKDSNFGLYSVLKTLGVQDEDMKKAWGKEIYESNATGSDKIQKDISKLYKKISERGVTAKGEKYDDIASAVVTEFGKTKLDPNSAKQTLGIAATEVDGVALLQASKRILAVARGDELPDDRDSLAFKRLVGIDNFVQEKISRPSARRNIHNKARNNIDRKDSVRDIITSDMFGKPVSDAFTGSLGRTDDQINPLEMISNFRSTTTLGGDVGGIKGEEKLTTQMKLINPSHMGFLDPIHTPESKRTGISLRMPLGVTKDGDVPKVLVYDLKEKKVLSGKNGISPTEMQANNIILPDQVTWKDGELKPIGKRVKMKTPLGDIQSRSPKDARYAFVSPHQLFDEATNLIPFLQNNQGNRTMVASGQQSQAVGLADREAPLVQVRAGKGSTWEKNIGIPFSHASPVTGEVVRIRTDQTDNEFPDSMVIRGDDGKRHEVQLYNHFPLNEAKSFMHSYPLVSKGDRVTAGQPLADTNFTKDGVLALGTNLRVSYLPYKGYNFEDGIVISDSAAQKLTSDHVHRNRVEIDPSKDFLNKKKFQAFASVAAKGLSQEQLDKLDEDGVIQLGSKVEPGDMLIAALGKKENMGIVSKMSSSLSKGLFQYGDKSSKWDGAGPGEVVKVKKHPGGKWAEVHVRTAKPAEVGDKMVGRHGNKGIITKILPNREMPRIGDPDGEHIQVLLNPSGVPSRINIGQMLETAASKIARKTGQPYVVNNFPEAGTDYTTKVKQDLARNGLKDTDVLFDPKTKKRLGDVLTGDQYILKLKHQVEKKLTSRSYGPNYTLEGAPKGSGSQNPGQAIGQLEFYSLLAHGARANLRDMATYKADRQVDELHNPQAHTDFWERVKMGQPLPPPRPTFAYKKFEGYLKALGVDIRKDGSELQLIPLTDKGVLNLSNGEIKDPGLVLRGKDAKELQNGLFDPKVTGGLPDPNDVGKGLNWSHITLAEPMPNPVFVGTRQKPGPAVVLTGLKFNEFEDVVKGKKEVDGRTGGAAIQYMLDKVDIDKELAATEESLPGLRKDKLNKANRKAKYLRALQDLRQRGLVKKPSDAYVMNHVPVLPPVMRPIVPMPDGSLRFDDVNHLYQSLGIVNNKMKDRIKEIPELEQKLREELYDIMKATAGVGGVPKFESNRQLKGILDTIAGDSPKQGFFQRRLMKRRQELSMRSTIIPEPGMHLDNLGLPRAAAMEMYKPFVIRELTFAGFSPMDAHKAVKAENAAAEKALEKAMEKRPVLLKRDPALHKFSFMAFKPKIVEGKAIRIHPLVTAGYNADFDGDAMAAFVPLSEEAADEAHKMFPSNNLFSSTTGGIMYSPAQESLLGLHLLSKWGKSTKKSFSNFAEAKQANNRGVIGTNDVITVGGKRTTFGRLTLVDNLPKDYSKNRDILHDPKFILKGGSMKDMLADIARTDPRRFASTVDKLKDVGNKHAYESGFSLSLNDLTVPKAARDQILAKADLKADMVNSMKIPQKDKDKRLIKIYEGATSEMEKKLKPQFAASDNNLFTLVDSGARGKWSQFRQMNVAPMLMRDASGKILTTPVRKSYSEGQDVGDYWTALHGARMGTLQRAEGTSVPGDIAKQLINTLIPELITSDDCGTGDGVAMNIADDDIHDRYLAKPVKAGSNRFSKGDLVTPHMTSALKRGGVSRIVVRSPLKCKHGSGLCATCYGLNEDGKNHDLGTNIGILAGHSMAEPSMQLAMDSFHTGGVAASRGGGAANRLDRLLQILNPPEKLPGAATLSKTKGKIQKIERDKATKGWNIYVGGEKHFASSQRTPFHRGKPLSIGKIIQRGDALTDGLINPRDLLPLTDVPTVQRHMVDELYNGIYKDERVRRRNIETVVRSLTNLAQVSDGGDSDRMPGDYVLRTIIEEENRKAAPGTKLIEATPILKGLAQGALDQQEDWMARLNFRRLKDTLMQGASKGWKTNIHGTNPVPAYAFGSQFGKGPDKATY